MSVENANLDALWPIMWHHHKFDFKWVQTIATNVVGNLETTELGYFVHGPPAFSHGDLFVVQLTG